MHKVRHALFRVECNAAKVLCVDGFFDASRHNSTSPASSHDCDQNITWADGVTSKVFILLMRYIPGLTLPEFIRHCIVDTENSNSFVNKFTMQQLASKRSSAD